MNNILKKISATAMAITMIGTGSAISDSISTAKNGTSFGITAEAAGYSTDYIYCTPATDLRLRKGPSTDYPLVKSNGNAVYVKTGINFRITKVSGNWGYGNIMTNTGKNIKGWVCLSYCNYFKKNNKAVQKTVNTKKDPLNVRTGPSAKYSITGSRDKGKKVWVYATCNGFSAIDPSLENWVESILKFV